MDYEDIRLYGLWAIRLWVMAYRAYMAMIMGYGVNGSYRLWVYGFEFLVL